MQIYNSSMEGYKELLRTRDVRTRPPTPGCEHVDHIYLILDIVLLDI
jgi:hypothetical protein